MNRRKCGFDFADDGFSGHVSGANATSTIGDDDYGTIIVCDDSNTVFAPIAIRFGRSDCLNIWHVAVVREPDNVCRNRAATKDCPLRIRPTSPLRLTAWLSGVWVQIEYRLRV